jgi:hypothetical protein
MLPASSSQTIGRTFTHMDAAWNAIGLHTRGRVDRVTILV